MQDTWAALSDHRCTPLLTPSARGNSSGHADEDSGIQVQQDGFYSARDDRKQASVKAEVYSARGVGDGQSGGWELLLGTSSYDKAALALLGEDAAGKKALKSKAKSSPGSHNAFLFAASPAATAGSFRTARPNVGVTVAQAQETGNAVLFALRPAVDSQGAVEALAKSAATATATSSARKILRRPRSTGVQEKPQPSDEGGKPEAGPSKGVKAMKRAMALKLVTGKSRHKDGNTESGEPEIEEDGQRKEKRQVDQATRREGPESANSSTKPPCGGLPVPGLKRLASSHKEDEKKLRETLAEASKTVAGASQTRGRRLSVSARTGLVGKISAKANAEAPLAAAAAPAGNVVVGMNADAPSASKSRRAPRDRNRTAENDATMEANSGPKDKWKVVEKSFEAPLCSFQELVNAENNPMSLADSLEKLRHVSGGPNFTWERSKGAYGGQVNITFPIILWYQHSWEEETKKTRTNCSVSFLHKPGCAYVYQPTLPISVLILEPKKIYLPMFEQDPRSFHTFKLAWRHYLDFGSSDYRAIVGEQLERWTTRMKGAIEKPMNATYWLLLMVGTYYRETLASRRVVTNLDEPSERVPVICIDSFVALSAVLFSPERQVLYAGMDPTPSYIRWLQHIGDQNSCRKDVKARQGEKRTTFEMNEVWDLPVIVIFYGRLQSRVREDNPLSWVGNPDLIKSYIGRYADDNRCGCQLEHAVRLYSFSCGLGQQAAHSSDRTDPEQPNSETAGKWFCWNGLKVCEIGVPMPWTQAAFLSPFLHTQQVAVLCPVHGPDARAHKAAEKLTKSASKAAEASEEAAQPSGRHSNSPTQAGHRYRSPSGLTRHGSRLVTHSEAGSVAGSAANSEDEDHDTSSVGTCAASVYGEGGGGKSVYGEGGGGGGGKRRESHYSQSSRSGNGRGGGSATGDAAGTRCTCGQFAINPFGQDPRRQKQDQDGQQAQATAGMDGGAAAHETRTALSAIGEYDLFHTFAATLAGGLNLSKMIMRLHFSIDPRAYENLPDPARRTWQDSIMPWYREFHRPDAQSRSRYNMLLCSVLRGLLGDGFTSGLHEESLDGLRVGQDSQEESEAASQSLQTGGKQLLHAADSANAANKKGNGSEPSQLLAGKCHAGSSGRLPIFCAAALGRWACARQPAVGLEAFAGAGAGFEQAMGRLAHGQAHTSSPAYGSCEGTEGHPNLRISKPVPAFRQDTGLCSAHLTAGAWNLGWLLLSADAANADFASGSIWVPLSSEVVKVSGLIVAHDSNTVTLAISEVCGNAIRESRIVKGLGEDVGPSGDAQGVEAVVSEFHGICCEFFFEASPTAHSCVPFECAIPIEFKSGIPKWSGEERMNVSANNFWSSRAVKPSTRTCGRLQFRLLICTLFVFVGMIDVPRNVTALFEAPGSERPDVSGKKEKKEAAPAEGEGDDAKLTIAKQFFLSLNHTLAYSSTNSDRDVGGLRLTDVDFMSEPVRLPVHVLPLLLSNPQRGEEKANSGKSSEVLYVMEKGFTRNSARVPDGLYRGAMLVGASSRKLPLASDIIGVEMRKVAKTVVNYITSWTELNGVESLIGHRGHFENFNQWCHSAHLIPFLLRVYRRSGVAGLAPGQHVGGHKHGANPMHPLVLPTVPNFCYGHCYPLQKVLQYFYGGTEHIVCSIDDTKVVDADRASLGLIAGQARNSGGSTPAVTSDEPVRYYYKGPCLFRALRVLCPFPSRSKHVHAHSTHSVVQIWSA
ncbi:unnamed protein product [Polarella glacialis]|uniref:Uncharacterized protein n=1 Tax=Polarella glacialis TaxID=89957 RepID=A0A813ETV3_POLGL|nr:unnamed protein product [Polarella glacialis]